MHNLKSNSKIWIQSGVSGGKKNIDVYKVYEHFSEILYKASAGFHAITGCDYNPRFYRKGKKTPFDIIFKSEQYQEAGCS